MERPEPTDAELEQYQSVIKRGKRILERLIGAKTPEQRRNQFHALMDLSKEIDNLKGIDNE